MKRNQLFYCLFLMCFTCVFAFISCQKHLNKSDDSAFQIENAKLKSSVNKWLDEQKLIKPKAALFIDSIRGSIDWKSAKLSPTVSADYVILYCPISYNKNSSGLIFTITKSDWAIKHGIISEIKFDNGNHDSEAEIIAMLYSNQTPNFSGSISAYTIGNKFVFERGFRNGKGNYIKLIEDNAKTGAVVKTNSIKLTDELPKQVNGNGCTLFYLVTYWSDGTVDRQFLSSICDNGNGGCEQTRVISPSSGDVYTTNCDSDNPGGGSNESELTILIINPGPRPISNIREYIKCFTATGTNCKVSILVDQPDPGTDAIIKFPKNVGHTFLTFSQTLPDGTNVTRNIGFYPEGNANPWLQASSGQLNNDESHKWNIGLEASLSSNDFMKILNYITGPAGTTYNLSNNNCSTMAINAMKQGGVEIFSALGYSSWLGATVNGYTPGRLGEDIRSMDLDPMFFKNLRRIYPPADEPSSSSHPNSGSCK